MHGAADEGGSAGARRRTDTRSTPAEATLALDRDGCAVHSLLSAAQVAALRACFARLGPAPGDGCNARSRTSLSFDPHHRAMVDRELRSALEEPLRDLVPDHRLLCASFAVAWPGPTSGTGVHREPVTTDERVHHSLLAWIALEAVDEHNGQLVVAPGSHRWPSWDETGTDASDPLPTELGRRIAREHSVPVPLHPGQAAVHDGALLKHSQPNSGDRPLLAVAAQLVPSDASTAAAVVEEGQLRVVSVGPRHWIEVDPFLPPPPGLPYRRPGRTAGAVADELAAAVDAAPRSGGATTSAPVDRPSRWCHRCGTASVAGSPDPWVGRNLVLCERCAAVEPELHASPPPRTERPVPRVPAAPPRRRHPRRRREPRVLRERAHDRRLRSEGYVRLPEPLLSADAAADLRSTFRALHQHDGAGFHNSFNDRDQVYRRAANDAVAAALDPVVETTFAGYEPFIRPFLCKWPGQASYFHPHRDWMYVDERAGARTFVLFVALEDIDDDNGKLRVLPGSHQVDDALRGTNMQAAWEREHADLLLERTVDHRLRVGEALIWNAATVHASEPNLTDEPRVAVGIWVRPKGEPLVHYRRIDDHWAGMYEADDEFFLLDNPYALMVSPPARPLLDVVPIDAVELGERDLERRLRR